MRILVFSDSHAGRQFMRHCIRTVRPDAIVHLGDYYEDGRVIAEENPEIVVHQVPGNCDAHRAPESAALTLCYPVCGVKLYMSHGHLHHVKFGTGAFRKAARRSGAQAALYGHTHCAQCDQEPDGMWVMNPGACGSYSGSAGVIETEDGEITACYLIRQEDLEENK